MRGLIDVDRIDAKTTKRDFRSEFSSYVYTRKGIKGQRGEGGAGKTKKETDTNRKVHRFFEYPINMTLWCGNRTANVPGPSSAMATIISYRRYPGTVVGIVMERIIGKYEIFPVDISMDLFATKITRFPPKHAGIGEFERNNGDMIQTDVVDDTPRSETPAIKTPCQHSSYTVMVENDLIHISPCICSNTRNIFRISIV